MECHDGGPPELQALLAAAAAAAAEREALSMPVLQIYGSSTHVESGAGNKTSKF
jgi:hypothetical protein